MSTDPDLKEYDTLEREFMMAQWDMMETMDAEEPHLRMGWCGYIPMVIGGSNC